MDRGAYGPAFGESMRLEAAPYQVTRIFHRADVAITEARSEQPDYNLSGSFAKEDAYLVALQVVEYADQHYWENDRKTPVQTLRAGETCLYDLKRDPRFLIDKPFHSLHFYIPRRALDTIAEEAHAPKVDELSYTPGGGVDDSVVRNLGMSMLSAFGCPAQVNKLFLDHVTLALTAHVAQTYGGLRRVSAHKKGGLAAWQEKRAQEMLAANLNGGISLDEVARQCGLSPGHFGRAFRKSTGLAPHQWLLHRRIQVSKMLMEDRRLTLTEIALSSGFADQSHFTRVFTKTVGVTPGAWRRNCGVKAQS